MAYVLEEYLNEGDNSYGSFGSDVEYGQTFTDADGFTITRVRLLLYRGATGTAGTLTVGIRATSSGNPTGANLVSDSMAVNDLTTNTAGAWYTFDFSPGLSLTAATMYGIVCTNSNARTVYWRTDTTSPPYAGGTAWTSSAGKLLRDQMFETYSGSEEEEGVLRASGPLRLLQGG